MSETMPPEVNTVELLFECKGQTQNHLFQGIGTDFEKFHQVVELSVNITTDCDGCTDWLNIRLCNEDLACLHIENNKFAA